MSQKTIEQKLFDLQMSASLGKMEYNQHGKFYYRTKEGILHAIKPLLKKLNLSVRIIDGVEFIQGKEGENDGRFFVKSTLLFTDLDTGETLSVPGWAMLPSVQKGMNPAQITGSSSSYAGKYALQNALNLDDNPDPDVNTEAQDTPVKTLTQAVAKKMIEAVEEGRGEAVKKKLENYEDNLLKDRLLKKIETFNN